MRFNSYQEHIMDGIKLIEELTAIPALSGYEDAMISTMRGYFEKHADEVYVDRIGNVVATLRGEQEKPSLLIFAHMDELGLVIRRIDKDGFVRFERVGGVPEKTLLGTWIEIHTDDGDVVPGLIGTTSHHVTPADLKYVVPNRLDMYIDIGCTSEEEVRSLGVQVGDWITYRHSFARLTGGRIAGKTMDNRVGCALLIQALAVLAKDRPSGTVHFVASVQEEFNVRGVGPVFTKLSPDAAICLDVTIACDTPELRYLTSMEIDSGPAIGLYEFHGRGTLGGLIPHPKLRRYLERIAADESIPLQREVMLGVITDASFSQLIGEKGVPMASIAVPCRYTHAPVEVVSYGDVEKALHLIVTAAQQFDDSVDLARGT
jgi:putative aminopeptidase FrvX